jgi:sarcosine oxidase subunit beta
MTKAKSRRKVIVCRCEDVTLADVEHSIELGYAELEEVKRYTGLGTGPCQGKECMALCASVIAATSDVKPTPFTSRPPVSPIALGVLARGTAQLDDTDTTPPLGSVAIPEVK